MKHIKQISEHRYRIKLRNGQTREFTDEDYANWLRSECGCAICGLQPTSAHHEPPVGRSGRDHDIYWKVAVPLCVTCHRKRHNNGLTKEQICGLVYEAKYSYPRLYIDWLGRII